MTAQYFRSKYSSLVVFAVTLGAVIALFFAPSPGYAQIATDCGLNQQTEPARLIEKYFEPECSLQSAIVLSRVLHDAFVRQDQVQYQIVFDRINDSFASERANNKNPECLEKFCGREAQLVDLVVSLQETWNHFYMEYLTRKELLSDLRTASYFAGGLSLGTVLLYFTLPQRTKYGGKLLARVAKSAFARIRTRLLGSPKVFLGRLAVGRTSVIVQSNMQLSSGLNSAPSASVEVFPSPFELINWGDIDPKNLTRDLGESFLSDLSWAVGGVAVFPALGAMVAKAGFIRLVALAQSRVWALRLLAVARKPSLMAGAALGGATFFTARAKIKIWKRTRFFQKEMARLKSELLKEKNLGSLSSYMKASKLVQDAVELSFMYTLEYLADTQNQEYTLMRNSHCSPYELPPVGQVYTPNVSSDIEMIFSGAQETMTNTRKKYADQLIKGAEILNETLDFIRSLKRSEFFDLEGRLRETEYVLNAYGSDSRLIDMWKTQGDGQMQRSGKFRMVLDSTWTKFQASQSLTPEEREAYSETLQYIDERIVSLDEAGDTRFQCLGLPGLPAVEMRQLILGQ